MITVLPRSNWIEHCCRGRVLYCGGHGGCGKAYGETYGGIPCGGLATQKRMTVPLPTSTSEGWRQGVITTLIVFVVVLSDRTLNSQIPRITFKISWSYLKIRIGRLDMVIIEKFPNVLDRNWTETLVGTVGWGLDISIYSGTMRNGIVKIIWRFSEKYGSLDFQTILRICF